MRAQPPSHVIYWQSVACGASLWRHLRKMLQSRNFVATVHDGNFFVMHESHKIPHLQDFVGTVHTGPATRRLESPSTRSLRPPQCPISALSPLERLREVAATDPSTLPQRAIQGATFMTAGRQKIIARPAPRSRSRERCLRRLASRLSQSPSAAMSSKSSLGWWPRADVDRRGVP